MIFPIPGQFEKKDGSFSSSLSVCEGLYEFYINNKSGNKDITYEKNALLKKDEYHLSVDKAGVHIAVSCEEGAFRALSSLRQLIENDGRIDFCEVHDCPDFEKRGYMLDISRCRMPKTETIKGLIDLLAELKYNEFQLYMESFCFKYDAYPQYTKDFDCLTPQDIEELDRYCAQRFIELVPNQNCFGHMGTWLAQPEFSHLEVSDGTAKTATVNPLLPETLEVVDKIFGSLLPHFSSGQVNIGMDEAGGLGKYQLEEACREKGKENVFMDYLDKISELCERKYGKSVQFWGDMISNYTDSFKRIPKNATVLNWGYDLIKNTMMEKRCMDLQNKGVKYYVCPGNCTWLSFTGRFDVMSFNVRTCGELGRQYGAAGYLMTDWGCGEGHMHFPVQSLVPCALAGQYAWNAGGVQRGESLKADFIRGAQKFIDDRYFGGEEASKYICRLQQYYLLEPERIHSSTICCLIFRKPLSETAYPGLGFFDLANYNDDFCFNNVISYVKSVLSDVEKLSIKEQYKREIILNGKMVILGEELCKVRMHHGAENEKIEYLITLTDEISAEYKELWMNINFEEGVSDFLGQLADRRGELERLLKI